MDEASSIANLESSLTIGEENPATSQSDASEIAGFMTDFQQIGQDLTE